MLPEEYLDHIIEKYTQGKFEKEVRKAKSEFFEKTGTAFDNDSFYEERLNLFLEWYLFSRPLSGYDDPPVKLFYQEKQKELSPSEKEVYHGFTQVLHSIFQVKKVKKGELTLKDFFNNKDIKASESKTAILTEGDIFEARLIPFQGNYYFGSGFCFHPAQSKSFIVKCIRKVKNLENQFKDQLLLDLEKMRLKHDRYPHIDIKYIYSFEAKI